MSDLTGKQRRHLRALGQRLAATVQVGHDGVTDALQVLGRTALLYRARKEAPEIRP